MELPAPSPVLTISLARFGKDQYLVELRYDKPGDTTEQPALLVPAEIDYTALRASNLSPREYGESLRKIIFSQPEIASTYKQYAKESGTGMRLRLEIHNSAPELHDLRWESLRTPDGKDFLALDSNQPFSRFLACQDLWRVDLRPKGKLKALVVIANPLGLDRPGGYPLGSSRLVPVPVGAEHDRARAALAGLPSDQITWLESDPHQPGLVSFDALKDALRQGVDILYLVAHGAMLPEKSGSTEGTQPGAQATALPTLALEYPLGDPKAGSVCRVPGKDLVKFIINLRVERRPRLVVLASCQSGGKGLVPGSPEEEEERSYDRGALGALGPLLVEAGIPAVVAMQGDIKQETIARFMPDFFVEVLSHGQVDKAMAIARQKIEGASAKDWDVPVLYLRLRDGRLWYEPFISGSGKPKTFWENLVNSIQKDAYSPCKCIPVLGYGLLETVSGSLVDAAHQWAKDAGYPLAPHQQQELPLVAEYLFTYIDRQTPYDMMEKFIREQAVAKYIQLGGSDSGQSVAGLLKSIEEIEYQRSQTNPEKDPYWILANLPFTVYINASPDNLLETALIARGKHPQVVYYPWKEDLKPKKDRQANVPGSPPTADCPLLFHLFGKMDEPSTWVLTEDDYFEYMMNIAKLDRNLDQVKASFTNNALLFLGFRINEWNFRVLYKSILTDRRIRELKEHPLPYRYLAIQLEPGDYNLDPRGAHQYLERYFSNDIFNLYWGNPESFLAELWAHWQEIKKVNL